MRRVEHGGAARHPALDWLTDGLSQIASVRRILLFGSRARGDHGYRSDIDLAVDAPGASPEDRARMAELVEDAPTLLGIDLVWLETAEPELRAAIDREGIVLYERSEAGSGDHELHAGVERA